MKSVTIENVKARIAQLETSEQIGGRLPIRHEFEMACLRKLADSLGGVDDDVRSVVALLENNEWAEHCTKTVLGSRLESEITRLYNWRSAQPAPVVPEEMTKSLASIAKEYQTSPQNALFIVVGWNACRAAMLQAGNEPPATDNTAQQFEALATSAQPEIIGYEHRLICGELRRVPKLAGPDIGRDGCEWVCDDVGTWRGKCGTEWQFFDDGPDENGMKFCPGCGKPVSTTSAGSGNP